MSDNKANDDNFTKRKTARKRKASQKLDKDFDLKKFKEKVFAELANSTYTV
jgi:hypothetical protein